MAPALIPLILLKPSRTLNCVDVIICTFKKHYCEREKGRTQMHIEKHTCGLMGVYYKLGLHLTLHLPVGTGIFISCLLISMHKLIIVSHAFLNT